MVSIFFFDITPLYTSTGKGACKEHPSYQIGIDLGDVTNTHGIMFPFSNLENPGGLGTINLNLDTTTTTNFVCIIGITNINMCLAVQYCEMYYNIE